MARSVGFSWALWLGRTAWFVALALVVLVTFSRCGSDKKKDDDKDKDGSGPVTPVTGEVPDAWDGKSDWSESPFEVIEE